jgi:hypothetical protein
MISGSTFSHVKHIFLTLEKNAFLDHSKHSSPSMDHNPHRSGLLTGSTRRHYRKEEDPHMHIEDRYKNKA